MLFLLFVSDFRPARGLPPCPHLPPCSPVSFPACRSSRAARCATTMPLAMTASSWSPATASAPLTSSWASPSRARGGCSRKWRCGGLNSSRASAPTISRASTRPALSAPAKRSKSGAAACWCGACGPSPWKPWCAATWRAAAGRNTVKAKAYAACPCRRACKTPANCPGPFTPPPPRPPWASMTKTSATSARWKSPGRPWPRRFAISRWPCTPARPPWRCKRASSLPTPNLNSAWTKPARLC